MTGPEHYREAERLGSGTPEDIASAQVHATLALAAATAETTMRDLSGPAYGYGTTAPTVYGYDGRPLGGAS